MQHLFARLRLWLLKVRSGYTNKPVEVGYSMTGMEKLMYESPRAGFFPATGTFHTQATDLGKFEVTAISKEKGTVSLCEVCTANEIEISIAAFELLFKSVPKVRLVQRKFNKG